MERYGDRGPLPPGGYALIASRRTYLVPECRSRVLPFVARANGGIDPPQPQEVHVPQYLLSLHVVEGEAPSMTQEEMEESGRQIHALNQEIRAAGAWVFGGALHGADTATTVSMAEGEVVTTDGPFAESKEHLGGFYVIEAADLDEALEWASKTTAAVMRPIEVRPFRDAES